MSNDAGSSLLNIQRLTQPPFAESVFDLRRSFTAILNISAEGGEEEEETDEGTGEEEEGTTDEGAGGAESGQKDDVKNPRIKQLSDEAAKHRNAAKAEKAAREAVEKRLREIEDKDKSELEKAQRDAKEATERAAKAEKALKESAVRLAFFESGAAAQFRNPATALRLLDLSDITPDDEGVVDPKAIKEKADDLLKREAYLGKSDDDGGSSGANSGQASGQQTNGRKKTEAVDRERLASKFPALRAR